MNLESNDDASRAARLGGWSLVAATVLFSAVFAYLAQTFGYPEVLDQDAATVLPRLLALGDTGRAVWVLYGLIPLLLVPAGLGVHALGGRDAPLAARLGLVAAVLGAACMSLGLMRWPSLQWQLALMQADAGVAGREAIAVVFAGANSLLGNFIGEFLGELFLNGFFLCATWVLHRAGSGARPLWLVFGAAASALGFIAMLRNATPMVDAFAAINNVVLPVWMAALGIAMVRHAPRKAAPASGRVSTANHVAARA